MTNKKYQPNIYRFYIPVIAFLSSIFLITITWLLYHFLHILSSRLILASSLMTAIFLIIFVFQIVNNKLWLYLRSLILTRYIRQMLVIPAEINEYTGKSKTNLNTNIYHFYLNLTYAEYKNNKLYICIRIPPNITAIKLLEDKLPQLCEAIDSRNKEYSFSKFDRQSYYYVRVGTK